MNGYNPMIDRRRNELLAQEMIIQQELANIDKYNQTQMMSQAQMQQPTAQPPQTRYYAKEVETFDEAKKTIPNVGEVYIFLDGKAGKIYLKQLNPDTGRSDYLTYALDQSEQQAEKDPITLIDERLSKIESSIGGLYESISGNAKVPAIREEPCGNDDRPVHSEPIPADESERPAEISPSRDDVKRKKQQPTS